MEFGPKIKSIVTFELAKQETGFPGGKESLS